MFNAGEADFASLGAIGCFGQGEKPAGVAVGERVTKDGGKNILCVIQEQGQQQLEDRCAGVLRVPVARRSSGCTSTVATTPPSRPRSRPS